MYYTVYHVNPYGAAADSDHAYTDLSTAKERANQLAAEGRERNGGKPSDYFYTVLCRGERVYATA